MDYEKKYNEALDKARTYYRGLANCRAKDELENIFPELSESEDERILRVISEAVITFFSDYANDFEDEDRDAALAWLEKQKENPKSSDSIPSDCASDAKCEDRWHKVSDSLPDNPREVLCKDEAGNYFIGRYYTGEGWEISNYDDEDKPHHLNPPVSKWIDFPSEKQKEQKPAECITDEEMKQSRDALHDFKVFATDLAKQLNINIDHRRDIDWDNFCAGLLTYLERNKPAEWSEEDERKRLACIETINEVIDYERERWEDYNPGKPYRPIMKYDEQVDWLKSLRPSWKPSEEQQSGSSALKAEGTNE